MKTEMEAERSAVSKDLQEHLKMMEEEVCAAIDLAPLLTRWKFSAERSRWNMLRELVAQLDSEILLVDRWGREGGERGKGRGGGEQKNGENERRVG